MAKKINNKNSKDFKQGISQLEFPFQKEISDNTIKAKVFNIHMITQKKKNDFIQQVIRDTKSF